MNEEILTMDLMKVLIRNHYNIEKAIYSKSAFFIIQVGKIFSVEIKEE